MAIYSMIFILFLLVNMHHNMHTSNSYEIFFSYYHPQVSESIVLSLSKKFKGRLMWEIETPIFSYLNVHYFYAWSFLFFLESLVHYQSNNIALNVVIINQCYWLMTSSVGMNLANISSDCTLLYWLRMCHTAQRPPPLHTKKGQKKPNL